MIPMMVVFGLHNDKENVFLGGGPNTHTGVPYWPAKAFLDTYGGGVLTAQCQEILSGFWGGAPNTHNSVPNRPAKLFLDTYDGGV